MAVGAGNRDFFDIRGVRHLTNVEARCLCLFLGNAKALFWGEDEGKEITMLTFVQFVFCISLIDWVYFVFFFFIPFFSF